MTRTIPIGEARRDLPRLVKQVALGGGLVPIGPRGRATAVLVDFHEYEILRRRRARPQERGDAWAALRLEVVGSHAELDEAHARLRKEIAASLEARLGRSIRPRERRTKRTR